MATEAQKNFRKQMKEIEEERERKGTPRVYSYINRDFVNKRTYITKRRVITLSGIFTIIAILFYGFPSILGSNQEKSSTSFQPFPGRTPGGHEQTMNEYRISL